MRRALVVAVGVPAAVGLLAPGFVWAAALMAPVVFWAVARRAPPLSAADRQRAALALAVRCDLLAACVDAGMAIGAALAAAAVVDDDPDLPDVARASLTALDTVGSLLALGTDARTAWRSVAADPDLSPVAAAATRSAVGGTGLSDALRDQADRLRRRRSAAATRSAGRAGVLMAAPLGICFLPAFLCLGLAPVVIGLIGRLGLF